MKKPVFDVWNSVLLQFRMYVYIFEFGSQMYEKEWLCVLIKTVSFFLWAVFIILYIMFFPKLFVFRLQVCSLQWQYPLANGYLALSRSVLELSWFHFIAQKKNKTTDSPRHFSINTHLVWKYHKRELLKGNKRSINYRKKRSTSFLIFTHWLTVCIHSVAREQQLVPSFALKDTITGFHSSSTNKDKLDELRKRQISHIAFPTYRRVLTFLDS